MERGYCTVGGQRSMVPGCRLFSNGYREHVTSHGLQNTMNDDCSGRMTCVDVDQSVLTPVATEVAALASNFVTFLKTRTGCQDRVQCRMPVFFFTWDKIIHCFSFLPW